ncbi:MAG TPA: S53 family peptidase [Mycobacteriales bacterium]|nr:S53 family peptidase [Mycobacteriales bacterium]
MRRYRRGITALGAIALLTGSAAGAATASAASARVVSTTTSILNSCAVPSANHVSCYAVLRARELNLSNGSVRPQASSGPTGYGPSDLRSAYNLTSASTSGGTGQTVAVVDAFDDPNAQADLNTYRAQFGLPACGAGCFSKVNQSGAASPLPKVDTGWAQEESLDIDMVSAICPNCHILLVEASSTSTSDLAASVNEAAALGATEISNSYGGGEASSETSLNSAYSHAGIAITASAGDSGYGVEFPAAAPTVTAVGGTTLSRASNPRGWTETVWGSAGGGLLGLGGSASGTGSGCSAYEAKPSWQKDAGCTKRTVADVSADANPSTGVAVYDSTADSSGNVGWLEFGGTSVASPIIAAVYAIAGNAASTSGASYAYAHTSSLNDVTSGTNGSCGGLLSGGSAKKYLCTAGAGYDGPTGLGTPNGTGAF